MSCHGASIARFALASAVAHVVLLAGLHSPARPVLFRPHEGVLTVQLAVAQSAAPQASPLRTARRAPERRKARVPRTDPSPDERARTETETRPTEPPAGGATADEQVAATEVDAAPEPLPRAWISARVEADLARHFDYPYLARLRGWEGTVWLAFRLEADGRLEAVRLARSSGFAALDSAALHSLERVERLPQAVAWLQGHPLDIELPVIYRLVGVR